MVRHLQLAAVFAALALAPCLPVAAQKASQGPVTGEVFVVLASETPGAIDATLKSIQALQKPPFSSFKSMKVLSRSEIAVDDDKPVTTQLPNGRTLQLTLVERMPDGRHKVQVSINRPSKKDYLPLLTVIASTEPFFVAGQKYEGGTLVIGVRIHPKGAPPAPAPAPAK